VGVDGPNPPDGELSSDDASSGRPEDPAGEPVPQTSTAGDPVTDDGWERA
jgi:hypothetical protein